MEREGKERKGKRSHEEENGCHEEMEELNWFSSNGLICGSQVQVHRWAWVPQDNPHSAYNYITNVTSICMSMMTGKSGRK